MSVALGERIGNIPNMPNEFIQGLQEKVNEAKRIGGAFIDGAASQFNKNEPNRPDKTGRTRQEEDDQER